MILLNNNLYFLKQPEEAEISKYTDRFYFIKGTMGCRGTHSYLYDKYNIQEVDDINLADIIIMEWPTFKLHNILYESDSFKFKERLYYIEKTKKYFDTVEEIWKLHPDKAKISVNTFLSCFLSDRESLTKDKFLDLYKKVSVCKTQESANVLMSNILNIDIKYRSLIGCLLYAGNYHSDFNRFTYNNTFFKKSRHSSMAIISSELLLTRYYNNELLKEEDEIVEQILDSNKDFFNFINDIKNKWKYISIDLPKKSQVVKPIEVKNENCDWNDF
jgi:hypothetical protein